MDVARTGVQEPVPLLLPAEARAILDFIRANERFVVCSHSRPDGDAVGSMLAMGMLLEQMGKRADLVTADRVPAVYRGLPGARRIQTAIGVHGLYDAAIVLECDGLARTRLIGLEAYPQINIDHHASGQEYATLNWIDRTACSVGEMVHRLATDAGCRVTPEMATCLYVTLLTDTGGFCYGGIDAATFALAGELTAAGADPGGCRAGCVFCRAAGQDAIAGTGVGDAALRGWSGVACGDGRRYDFDRGERGRLRRNRELCAFDRRRGGGGISA